jgi:hypothetical protein
MDATAIANAILIPMTNPPLPFALTRKFLSTENLRISWFNLELDLFGATF